MGETQLQSTHLDVCIARASPTSRVFSPSREADEADEADGRDARLKSVYRRNNMAGAGCEALLTGVKDYYLQSHRQTKAAPSYD